MDLEVLGAIDEAEHGSITKETEEAAQAILDEFHEDPSEPRKAAEAEGAPRPMPSGAPQEADQATVLQGIMEEIEECVKKKDYAQAAALHSLRESLSTPLQAASKTQRSTSDIPLVDPPEFGERVQDIHNQDPYWIPGAFPTVFQNETGDPYNAPLRPVDLLTWGPHALRSRGWCAQTPHNIHVLVDELHTAPETSGGKKVVRQR